MPNVSRSGHVVVALLLSLCTACAEAPGQPADPKVIPESELGSAADPNTADQTPLAGIELDKLSPEKAALFYTLVNSLSSPCGKSHSLRTSFTSDTECKRARFAVRYVRAMLEDDATEVLAREEYARRYQRRAPLAQLDLSKAPHFGSDDAPIKLAEFIDYECPHCAVFKTALEQVLAERPGKLEVFVMMYPLEKAHPESRSAAKAALAASAQGKFKEMHDLLFAKTPRHSRDDVIGYAKELDLDLDKFTAAYDGADRHVASDQAQGDTASVSSTPSLFVNDRKYDGPMSVRYVEMIIDEELGGSR